jgi:hypothetical protein
MLEKLNGVFNILNLQLIDRHTVPILDIIRLDVETWGRLDLIVNSYYNFPDSNGIDYLSIFLDWNNINDISTLEIGRLLEVPDITYLLQFTNQNNILFNDEVPGVIKSSDTHTIFLAPNPISPSNNTGNTKLELTQVPANYDPETGILTL